MMRKLVLVMMILSSSVMRADYSDAEPVVYDFNASVNTIVELLRAGNLGSIVEECTDEKLDVLIKNFSPALMAFEAEVLSCTMPVLLYFYRTTDSSKATTDALVATLAQLHHDHTKIVAIDADLFFSLSQAIDVQETPTFALCRNRMIEVSVTCSENVGRVTALMQQ